MAFRSALLFLSMGASAWSPAQKRLSGQKCDFVIHYNRWVSTFEPGLYGLGTRCLERCCRDPSCKGVALESTLDTQCYKYAKGPKSLDGPGEPLAKFLAGNRVREWSIVVKKPVEELSSQVNVSRSLVGMPMLTDGMQNAIASRSRRVPGLVSREAPLDKRLRGPSDTECEWTVHYNKWIPTFDRGEYTHDDAFGGAHAPCLDKCCQDPSCTGLAMESSELYQCYKYSHVPSGLSESDSHKLGDGLWLLHKPQAWSIMVKSSPPKAAVHRPEVSSSGWWRQRLWRVLKWLAPTAALAASLAMFTTYISKIMGVADDREMAPLLKVRRDVPAAI